MKPMHNEHIFIQAISEGYLQIDNNGKVWCIAKKYMKKKYPIIPKREVGYVNNKGYVLLHLHRNAQFYRCLAHRVIWIYYNGEIPDNLEINHKNGIKTDNYLENLELVTRSENKKHAYRIGLINSLKGQNRPKVQGEKHWSSKLIENDVREIRLRFKSGEKQGLIAQDFNINKDHISRICCKKYWSHIE